MSETRFPDALRVPGAAFRLEAAGRRAFAAESPARDALEIVLAGRRASIAFDPPLRAGDVQAWPFASLRSGDPSGHLLFAAADHPVVMLEISGLAMPVRVARKSAHPDVIARAGDTIIAENWTTLVPDGDGRIRITVHVGAAMPDVDALMGSAVARARRRAAQRPRVRRPSDTHDVVAALDHALRVQLAADPSLGATQRVTAFLALLAMNDAPAALDVARDYDDALASDADLAVVIAGAWAAWRGDAVPLAAVRAAVTRDGAPSSGGTSWRDAAAALVPFVADLMDRGSGARKNALEPSRAIVAAARAAGAPVAAVELLELLHEEMGLMPDAGRARIRIAPRLIAGRTEIDQIGVGDAALFLHADVGNERASIEVEQTSGATPLTAILEPRVPGGRLRSALVEETPAELDTGGDEGDLTARVQLIIDRRRRLVLNFERR